MIELRDPATGKIKPVYLIAGGGIVLFGIILLMGKGSSGSSTSGVTSGGQSSDITGGLSDLQQAILSLARNPSSSIGGAGGAIGASATGGEQTATVGTVVAATPVDSSSTIPGFTIPSLGDSYIPPTVGEPYLSNPSNPISSVITPPNTYPVAANTPVAVTKPSNSGISSAPISYTPSTFVTPSYSNYPGEGYGQSTIPDVALGKYPSIVQLKPTLKKHLPSSHIGQKITPKGHLPSSHISQKPEPKSTTRSRIAL